MFCSILHTNGCLQRVGPPGILDTGLAFQPTTGAAGLERRSPPPRLCSSGRSAELRNGRMSRSAEAAGLRSPPDCAAGTARDLLPTAGPQVKRPQRVAAASSALFMCAGFLSPCWRYGINWCPPCGRTGCPAQRGRGGRLCWWPRLGLRPPRPAEEGSRTPAGCRPHVQPAVRLDQVGEVPLPRRYHCLCHLARPAQLVQEALHPLPFVRWHSHH